MLLPATDDADVAGRHATVDTAAAGTGAQPSGPASVSLPVVAAQIREQHPARDLSAIGCPYAWAGARRSSSRASRAEEYALLPSPAEISRSRFDISHRGIVSERSHGRSRRGHVGNLPPQMETRQRGDARLCLRRFEVAASG